MDPSTDVDDGTLADNAGDEFPPETALNQPDPAYSKGATENVPDTHHLTRLKTFFRNVTGMSCTVTGVRHYAEYTIHVRACQGFNPMTNMSLCSKTAVTQARTKQNGKVD